MRTARRANPDSRAEIREKIDAAGGLFQDFSGHEAERVEKINRKVPRVALAIGELDFVGYTAKRDGKQERYIHRFPKKSRPLLAASHDGRTLEILGGEFQFTEAGIEG